MLNFKAIMFFINFIFINKMYFSSASEIVTDWSKWDGLKSPFLRAFAQSLKQETCLALISDWGLMFCQATAPALVSLIIFVNNLFFLMKTKR